ncbi:MAG TPA: flagellar basal body-associated FliL family protein [Ignavibacteriales bacterium]|nr:flagellar basal body-associated FliL family protein [Ignavibacteriales bacterium]
MEENFEPNLGPEKKSAINPKIFLVGLPLFIVQLVVVYFITANILLSKFDKSERKDVAKTENVETDSLSAEEGEEEAANEESSGEETKEETHSGEEGSKASPSGNFIYTVNDVIINPAGTNGQRLMLTSIGFDMKSESQLKKIETKEVVLKDAIISVLSRKTVSQLSNTMKRDSLKIEIMNDVKNRIPGLKINDLYFSKYIIQ